MKYAYFLVPVLAVVAANASAFDAVARVTNVTPITETINRPTQKCWTESRETTQPAPHNYGGAVLGTIAGGIIGSQIGKGNGTLAAGAVGAAVGAVTGDHIANSDAQATTTVPVQRCEAVDNFETRVSGYRVTYEYDNWKFTTRLPYN